MSGGWVNQLCALAALAGHAPTPAASLLACSGSMRPPPLPCRASRRSSACAGFRPRACCGAGVAGPSAAPRPLVLAPAPLAWRSSGAPRGQSAAVRMLQGYRGRWASAVGQQGGRCSGAACRRRRQRQRGNRRRRPPHPTCSTPPELGGQLVLHAGRHPVAQQRELRHLRSGWEAWVSRGRGRQSSCTAGAALHQGWLAFQPLLLVTKRCTCRSRLPARTWRACAPAAAERLNSPNTAPGSSSDPSLHSTSSSSSSSSSSSPSDPSASDSDSSSSPIARGPSSSSATRARRAAAAAASSPLLAPRLRSSSESGPAGSAACWCGR